MERRFINAMQYLRYRDRVRWIKVTPEPRERSGWVWDHYPLTDDEWAARANMMERPAPIARTKAPQAHVVIITGPVPAIDESQEAPGEHEEEPCL